MSTNRLGAIRAVTAGFCLAFAGCQALDQPRSMNAELRGQVTWPENAPIVVVAFERGASRIAHRAFLAGDRSFALPLTAGLYKIYAFADQDRDGSLGAGEPRSQMYALASPLRAGERRELPPLSLR
jgi:hypothetical protein